MAKIELTHAKSAGKRSIRKDMNLDANDRTCYVAHYDITHHQARGSVSFLLAWLAIPVQYMTGWGHIHRSQLHDIKAQRASNHMHSLAKSTLACHLPKSGSASL